MKTPKTAMMPVGSTRILAAGLCCFFMASSIHTMQAESASAQTKPGEDQLLNFSNGDVMHGSVAGFDKAGLHWKYAYVKTPAVFSVTNLSEVVFPARPAPANAMQMIHEVLLVNGDLLPGNMLSFDGKSLALDTWYAGKLNIPRAMIKSITTTSIIYKGPTGLEGWVVGHGYEGSWSYDYETLVATKYGTIGRDMKLPEQARIEFDLVAGANTQVNVYFCSAEGGKCAESYLFEINSSPATVNLIRYSPNTPNVIIGEQKPLHAEMGDIMTLGQIHQVPLNAKGASLSDKNHFDIRIDKEAKSIWLYVNGNLVGQYSGLDDLPKMGGSLIFSPGYLQHPGAPMEVSKIEISRWNGGLGDEKRNDDRDATQDDTDYLKAANRASLHGKLKGIGGGKVGFSTAEGDLEIPLKEIDWIRMAPDKNGTPKPGTNDVRVQLLVNGSVTMEIESWDAKHVTATSADFGKAVFLPDAFQLLQFHPGDPAVNK